MPKKEFLRRATEVLKHLRESASELSVLIVDDAAMKKLNRHYRGKNRSTDVLSFCQREVLLSPQKKILGDVVISIETARKQAEMHKKPVIYELTLYLIHGILHLVGYDHDSQEDHERMDTQTQKLLKVCYARKTT